MHVPIAADELLKPFQDLNLIAHYEGLLQIPLELIERELRVVLSLQRCGVVSCSVVSCEVVSCGVVSCGVVSCGVVSRGVISCGVVSCGVVS